MFDHSMAAGIVAAKVGDSPCGVVSILFLVAFGALIHYLVKKSQKEREAAGGVHRRSGGRSVAGNVLERSDSCRRLARELGLEFHPADPWNLPERYADFALFSVGHSRLASNVIAGDLGGSPVVLCDYECKVGEGLNEGERRFQVAVLELPIVAPLLEVLSEKGSGEIASWVGDKDLLFEDSEFNMRCHTRCEEPKFAYEIFHAGLVRYMLSCGRRPNLAMRGPVMILYFEGRGDVELFQHMLSVGRHVIESIQEDVRITRGPAADEGRPAQ